MRKSYIFVTEKPADSPVTPSALFQPTSIDTEKRVALVIGNADYEHLKDLPSDIKDAEDVAAALEKFGFDVILKTDVNLKDMDKAINEFADRLQKNTVGVFYYSGHGSEINGKQYILPIDAVQIDVDNDRTLLDKIAMNINSDVIRRVKNKARLMMLVLDACRTNPFVNEDEVIKKGGIVEKGFHTIGLEGGGMLIASSTASGQPSMGAEEGSNSPYTAELLKILQEKPETKIADLFNDVGVAVQKNYPNYKQSPWVSMSPFEGEFYFLPPSPDEPILPEKPAVTPKTEALTPLALLQKDAEQGDASAQVSLGYKYDFGDGVAKDKLLATGWYRKAAEQGDAGAQFALGTMYNNGEGVSKDKAQAVVWYRKAAEQGNAYAQFNLGVMYDANGEGIAQDKIQAVAWYRKAAEQGYASAQFNLGVMYSNGEGVVQDKIQAVAWYRKAAEQSDADAKNALKYEEEQIALSTQEKNPPKKIHKAKKHHKKTEDSHNVQSLFTE
jgi:hypothetical protein